MYGRDVVGYFHLHLTSHCRHPAPGQDLIPLQRLHVFAHSRDPHPAIKLWCQVPFTKSETIFHIEMYCMPCFLKSKYTKRRTFNDKNRALLRKLWSLRSYLLILPPWALTPQGIGGAMKRDVSKHWCTLQWCDSRGWFVVFGICHWLCVMRCNCVDFSWYISLQLQITINDDQYLWHYI